MLQYKCSSFSKENQSSFFKPIYSPHHQNYQHLQDLICIEFWGIKLVKFCVFPQTLTETDKCMYVHNFRKSNHSQRTCKQLKNKTKTKVCILEKLIRGGLQSSRSCIIPLGKPQLIGGLSPSLRYVLQALQPLCCNPKASSTLRRHSNKSGLSRIFYNI